MQKITSVNQRALTFSADAGAVHGRAGGVVVAGAGGCAAWSVQAGRTHRSAVLPLGGRECRVTQREERDDWNKAAAAVACLGADGRRDAAIVDQ